MTPRKFTSVLIFALLIPILITVRGGPLPADGQTDNPDTARSGRQTSELVLEAPVDYAPENNTGIITTSQELDLPQINEDYLIQGKDLLKVIVYGEPDLSKDSLRVSVDGYVNTPLLGNISVAGLTTSQIESKIEKLLADGYILQPQVSVLLIEFGRRIVFVLGAVGSPGSFELGEELTLLEILTQAGGLTESAGKKILIKRTINRKRETIAIDKRRLLVEGDLTLNIQIYDRDFIYVPESDIIYILGEVNSPGSYPLSKENNTVFQALLRAGGVTKLAAPKRIQIIREVNGIEEVIRVNYLDFTKRGDMSRDIDLKPEDVIIVPVAYF